MKDTLYQRAVGSIAPFAFNEEVVAVFDDMIKRSVPGYGTSLELAAVLAARYCQENAHIYDLGCSLGACALAIANQPALPSVQLTAVDVSLPMLLGFESTVLQLMQTPTPEANSTFPRRYQLRQKHTLALELADITEYPLQPCRLVLLNYVLQFIPLQARSALLAKIYEALEPGGVLMLCEKLTLDHEQDQTLVDQLHLCFKRLQGYSDLEIHGKRTALEEVLIPETLDAHKERLYRTGFSQVTVVGYHLNFANIVAIKSTP